MPDVDPATLSARQDTEKIRKPVCRPGQLFLPERKVEDAKKQRQRELCRSRCSPEIRGLGDYLIKDGAG